MMRRVTFRYHSTPELIAALDARRARQRAYTRWTLGADVITEAGDTLDHAIATSARVMQTAIRAGVNTVSTPWRATYDVLRDGAASLAADAQTLAQAGLELEAQAVRQLAQNTEQLATAWGRGAGQFAAELGRGLGEAEREVLGLKPGEIALVAGLFGLLVLGGAGYVLLTPGGQELAVGGGRALSRLAAAL